MFQQQKIWWNTQVNLKSWKAHIRQNEIKVTCMSILFDKLNLIIPH
jgi:hypothetical protein